MGEDKYEKAKKVDRSLSRLCVTLPPDIFRRLNDHIEKHGFDRSKLVACILEDYLKDKE